MPVGSKRMLHLQAVLLLMPYIFWVRILVLFRYMSMCVSLGILNLIYSTFPIISGEILSNQ